MALETIKFDLDRKAFVSYDDFCQAAVNVKNVEIPTREEFEKDLLSFLPDPIQDRPGCYYGGLGSHTYSSEGSYCGKTLPRCWADPDLRPLVPQEDWFSSYGVCDGVDQFLEVYGDALRKSDRRFVVKFCEIRKADQPEQGGWRWHKWGPYIGKHQPEYEYLYDEKGIDSVWIYEVCEITDGQAPQSRMQKMREEMNKGATTNVATHSN